MLDFVEHAAAGQPFKRLMRQVLRTKETWLRNWKMCMLSRGFAPQSCHFCELNFRILRDSGGQTRRELTHQLPSTCGGNEIHSSWDSPPELAGCHAFCPRIALRVPCGLATFDSLGGVREMDTILAINGTDTEHRARYSAAGL